MDENLIVRTETEEDSNLKIQTLFENHKVDGIFALEENDSVAALKFGLKFGYKIPENLSIIGFADGILASRRLSPSITTVSQHGPEIGEAAAKLLIERLESKEEENPYKTSVIKTELRERESSRRV
jgi:LacI family transcriptional regulator